jgi:hypothetical protein
MLGVEPLAAVPSRKGETPLVAKPPNDISGAGTTLVINFENPVLVAHGQQKVAIDCVNDRIAVAPVCP